MSIGGLTEARVAELSRAWHARDVRPLRALVEEALGDPRQPHATLSVWRRFSQAVYTGQRAPLLAHPDVVGRVADPDDWTELSEVAWRSLIGLLPDQAPDSAETALLSLFCYFEALAFWEYSYDHEPVVALVDVFSGWVAGLGAPGEDDLHWRTVDATRMLAESLPCQFEVEDALGATSPRRLSDRARVVVVRLEQVEGKLAPDSRGPDDVARTLVGLLRSDVGHTLPFFRLLAEAVGPAARAFEDNLGERDQDKEVLGCLDDAIAACVEFERSPAGRRGVFASESRAHRLTLESSRDLLLQQRASLTMTGGEVAFVYPFGLPVSPTGSDVVRQRLRAHFEGGEGVPEDLPVLCGMPTVLMDTPQTDAWAPNLGEDHLIHVGVRLLWESHELVLRTADGVVFRDLNLEVRLGGLGNYYVRAGVGTNTPVSHDGGETWERGGTAWTPHQVDQFVRRIGDECGDNTLWFVPRGAAGTQTDGTTWSGFVDLVAHIIHDLANYAAALDSAEQHRVDATDALAAEESWDDALVEYSEDLVSIRAFLKRHAHAVLVVTEAVAVDADGRRFVEEAPDLQELAGYSAWVAPQRSFATGILEWVRSDGSDRGSTGPPAADQRERASVRCHGDTTLVFAGNCPHWQVLETRELVEFSASLIGVYARRREWLTRSAARDEAEVRTLLQPGRIEGLDLSELRSTLAEVRRLDIQLQERISRVRTLLDQARTFMLSRSYHSRGTLAYLCSVNGVEALGGALEASVGATSSLQELVRSRIDRLANTTAQRSEAAVEERRARRERPVTLLLTVLAVLSLIDLFSWSNTYLGLESRRSVWLVEVSILLGLVVGVLAWSWERRARGGDDDPSTDEAAPPPRTP
ncbi:hypothetical protein [Nocardioides sediminis]|uniref:hypothetical protein n=1 Tax=Nocardioides sediminis TaxID=433648 RepID=UPI000D31F208|nr:hypothetical protein [Nocardioides sediminis]